MKKILILKLLIISLDVYSFAEERFDIPNIIQKFDQNEDKTQSVPLIYYSKPQVEESLPVDSTVESKNISADNLDSESKAFLEKKDFLKDNKRKETSLWQSASLVVAFISMLGALAFIMQKINKKSFFKKQKIENVMNIISTISISPKRQIMLLQIRDKEIVISNTESGINFISDIQNRALQKESIEEKRPLKLSNFMNNFEKKIEVNENKLTENKLIENNKKSDILMKAIKKIEKEKKEEVNKKEEKLLENNSNSAIFPKYISNIFENESKKEVKKKDDNDSVESVTNLIREKLRSMKPLN